MSVSTLSFSGSLPPFYYTSGYNTNFSNSNTSFSGNVLLSSSKDSNGSNTTTISSSVNSNGTSYNETGASLSGNQLTINYQTDSTDLNALENANINGAGIGFNPANAIASGGSLTTLYGANPNGAFGETVQGAAISTGSGSENIKLQSVAEVGNSLTVTFDIGGAPVSTTTLALATAPQSSAPTPAVFSGTNSPGAGFSSHGIMTIGELLANNSGLAANGTFNNALQSQQSGTQGQANATPNEALVLAATLNSSVNLSPSQNLQVADFANTSANAFPTAAPADANTISSTNNSTNNNFDTSGSGGNNNTDTSGGANAAIADQNSTPDFSNSGNASNAGAFSQSAGIYSAVANASSSNIAGSNYSTVA